MTEDIAVSEGGSRAVRGAFSGWRTASSKAVMRASRHFTQFTVGRGYSMLLGVIRPGWDVEGGNIAPDGGRRWWGDDLRHCFYHTGNGRRSGTNGTTSWDGIHIAPEEGDRIGMLLDLDQGSMTVYKNDERLGVMATGLSGEYSWAVALWSPGSTVRIEAAVAPASPTAEELAQAVAYQAEQAL
jgi:hypothetical protein